MNIQSERRRVMLELLCGCDQICRANGLKYTITGTFAENVLEGRIPDDYDYIFIAMTTGDLERFVDIVNSEAYPNREVEYFLNNPNATGHEYRFCNNETHGASGTMTEFIEGGTYYEKESCCITGCRCAGRLHGDDFFRGGRKSMEDRDGHRVQAF